MRDIARACVRVCVRGLERGAGECEKDQEFARACVCVCGCVCVLDQCTQVCRKRPLRLDNTGSLSTSDRKGVFPYTNYAEQSSASSPEFPPGGLEASLPHVGAPAAMLGPGRADAGSNKQDTPVWPEGE